MAPTLPQTDGTPAAAPPAATPLAPAPATDGAASAANQQAPPPKDNFAPRKFGPAAPSSSSGAPDMLRLVATQPLWTVQQLALSSYIPTTLNLFMILASMDSQMIFTHKFTQSNPNWCPLISQLYISLLLYIHIIRCMVEANPTNMELTNFYDILYRHLGLDSLIVPGPLVPVFAAITLSASPHEWIGNIFPTLPLQTGATARNGFRLNNRVYMVLPSIPFIIDQIHELADLVNLGQASYDLFPTRIFNIFSHLANTQTTAIYNVLTPNARYYVHLPFAQAQRFVATMPYLGLPSRLTTAPNGSTTEMSYLQFFGFEPYSAGSTAGNWLTTIGPIMSTYSTYFKGSVSLMSISSTGLGASLPVAIYRAASHAVPLDITTVAAVTANAAANPPVVAAPGYVERNRPSNNSVDIHHAAPNLSELAEQYASIALVNCDFTNSTAASNTVAGPTNATLRSGHYWTLPTVRQGYDLNTSVGIANNVSSYYHVTTPLRST